LSTIHELFDEALAKRTSDDPTPPDEMLFITKRLKELSAAAAETAWLLKEFNDK
jgi:hypothetical protein